MTTGTGEDNLRNALASLKPKQKPQRQDDPCPGEEDWGWWIEKRIARLETSKKWIITLIIGIAVEIAVVNAIQVFVLP
jgi:hypothetical protein